MYIYIYFFILPFT